VSAPALTVLPEAVVWAALEDVADPEIPAVSIVDLGIVRTVDVRPGSIRVELLPTFMGCPAIDMMREAVVERLAPLAETVEAEISYAEPWTTERISAQGRERLRVSGFAPPPVVKAAGDGFLPVLEPAVCPFCGSTRTALENAFGPTLCRAIAWCAVCRQPFEQFKPI
jgi:ring-1,2-phenylacetyl-CoA epoxidase subunit PaaD